VDSKIYNYVYDNEDIILEYLAKEDGKQEVTRYVHGPGIDEPLAIERKGEIYFYYADGLGSIMALTDSKQKVVESYSYSSFGEIKRRGDKVKNTYMFTAREWDEEIGLYYYRARYYDAEMGRFISFDPILHSKNSTAQSTCYRSVDTPSGAFSPLQLNPYIYAAENNPLKLLDPFGLEVPSNTWVWECDMKKPNVCEQKSYRLWCYHCVQEALVACGFSPDQVECIRQRNELFYKCGSLGIDVNFKIEIPGNN